MQDATNISLLDSAPPGGALSGIPDGHLAAGGERLPSPPHREARERELLAAYNEMGGGDAKEARYPPPPRNP